MTGARPYLGRGGFRVVGYLLSLAGVAAVIAGPVYAINGATQAPGWVTVAPTYDGERVLPAPDLAPQPSAAPGGWPDGVQEVVVDGSLVLRAWDSTVAEQLLARGAVALLGLDLAATTSVLERTGLAVEGAFAVEATFAFGPFVLATGLLVLAEAFRRGVQLADDVEGLV